MARWTNILTRSEWLRLSGFGGSRLQTRDAKLDDFRSTHPSFNFVENRHWAFTARIIGSQDRDIAQPAGDFAHDRPLAAITIAAAAKHSNQFSVGDRPDGAENLLQRVRGMGIVDQNRDA